MTCAGRSRSRSLALPVSARIWRTRPGGNARAITPRLMWSLRRTPDGRPAGAPAIAADPATPDRQPTPRAALTERSEEHTSELQSRQYLVCRLLLEKK